MRQKKAWGVMTTTLMVFILVASCAVDAAFGQARAMQFEIPYSFTFGTKVLPAGTYTFSENQSFLAVQPATGGPMKMLIITWLSGPADFFRGGSVVFDKTDDRRILSEIWWPGSDGILVHSIPKSHGRDLLFASDLSQTGTVSGKKAYNLTCGRCHGMDGMGDKRADKFFDTTIPRLSSAGVQSKSDAELREQISQGSRLMPPVEIDESGFRHRLPPQDVDAVIAYVRTMKQ